MNFNIIISNRYSHSARFIIWPEARFFAKSERLIPNLSSCSISPIQENRQFFSVGLIIRSNILLIVSEVKRFRLFFPNGINDVWHPASLNKSLLIEFAYSE